MPAKYEVGMARIRREVWDVLKHFEEVAALFNEGISNFLHDNRAKIQSIRNTIIQTH